MKGAFLKGQRILFCNTELDEVLVPLKYFKEFNIKKAPKIHINLEPETIMAIEKFLNVGEPEK